MKQIKAIKFRIYPSLEQISSIDHTIDSCRYIYNKMIERNKKIYQRRKEHLSYYDMQNLLPLMKVYLPWLKDADSQALKYACRCADTAYQKFFKKQTKCPKFHSKHSSIQSYTTTCVTSIRYTSGSVKLPKLGDIKTKENRPLCGKICYATISRHNDKYYVSITYKREVDIVPITVDEKHVLGLDYKSSALYADNYGHTADMPHFYRNSQKKLRKLQRQISKMNGSHKGDKKSHRWIKKQKQIKNLYAHITNQREDYLHKLSTILADRYDAVSVESLNMSLLSNKGFGNGKATLDNGYGMFLSMLEYKMKDRGKYLVRVDKWYPSSQTCSHCGSINPIVKDLRIREWTCPVCGTTHDRDTNAASNIRNEGIQILIEEGKTAIPLIYADQAMSYALSM